MGNVSEKCWTEWIANHAVANAGVALINDKNE